MTWQRPDDGICDPIVVDRLTRGQRTPATVTERRVAADLLDAAGADVSTIRRVLACQHAALDRWLATPRTYRCRHHPDGHRYPGSAEVCAMLDVTTPQEVPA